MHRDDVVIPAQLFKQDGGQIRAFPGLPDLLKVTIDTATLAALPDEALRWEPSRGGDLFPHLYVPLPLSAVRSVEPCHVDAEGRLSMEAGA